MGMVHDMDRIGGGGDIHPHGGVMEEMYVYVIFHELFAVPQEEDSCNA